MDEDIKEKIVSQCRKIMRSYFIDDSVFEFYVEKEDYVFHVLVIKNGKIYFEFDNIFYEIGSLKFIQYGFSVH